MEADVSGKMTSPPGSFVGSDFLNSQREEGSKVTSPQIPASYTGSAVQSKRGSIVPSQREGSSVDSLEVKTIYTKRMPSLGLVSAALEASSRGCPCCRGCCFSCCHPKGQESYLNFCYNPIFCWFLIVFNILAFFGWLTWAIYATVWGPQSHLWTWAMPWFQLVGLYFAYRNLKQGRQRREHQVIE